jgi:chromate transporter
MEQRGTLPEIAREFLRLGFVAYGGAAAHIAMMEERFVRQRAWVTRERFVDLVGAVNLLPGPSSTELAIYLGEIRGGVPGLITAGACFILPAAVLVVALAWAYLRFGAVPQMAGLLFGIKPVVVALMVQAIWNLSRTALKSAALAILAVCVVALAAWGIHALLLLIGAGILWMIIGAGRSLARTRAAVVGMIGTGAAGRAVRLARFPCFSISRKSARYFLAAATCCWRCCAPTLWRSCTG